MNQRGASFLGIISHITGQDTATFSTPQIQRCERCRGMGSTGSTREGRTRSFKNVGQFSERLARRLKFFTLGNGDATGADVSHNVPTMLRSQKPLNVSSRSNVICDSEEGGKVRVASILKRLGLLLGLKSPSCSPVAGCSFSLPGHSATG